MNMEAQTDRAVETATNAAHEAYSVTGEATFVYDKESWADCIADIVTDPETDEELRQIIRAALYWIDAVSGPVVGESHALVVGSMVARSCQSIGELIIKNALKNGVTLENIGKVE